MHGVEVLLVIGFEKLEGVAIIQFSQLKRVIGFEAQPRLVVRLEFEPAGSWPESDRAASS
jgi:hypothetical protein